MLVYARSKYATAMIGALVAFTGALLGPADVAAQWKIDNSIEYIPPRKYLPWVPMEAGMRFVEREPGGPLVMVISLGTQTIDVYDPDGRIASAPISSGRKEYETPEGVFSVIEKREEHFSNLYDDAHMPFMQRLTWSGIALHQGLLPGRPASHGCVRLPGGFAEWLFKQTRIATRVLVTPHRPRPVSISHPALPGTGTTASSDAVTIGRRGARSAAEAALAAARSASERHTEAKKAAEAAAAASAELRKASLRVETVARRAEARARADGRRVEQIKVSGAALERARDAAATSAARLHETTEKREAARRALATAEDARVSAETAVGSADAAMVEAWAKARAARLAASPVTVLVSREKGRIFVRQRFEPVAEIAFTLREPAKPIGTHVFTVARDEAALQPAHEERGRNRTGLVWQAVTVEDPTFPTRRKSDTTGRLGPLHLTGPIDEAQLAERALDRLELPSDVLARIEPYLHPGATLIVSDRAPSHEETGKGTDLVVLTNPGFDLWANSN